VKTKTLTAEFTVTSGSELAVVTAAEEMMARVRAEEPGTLVYLLGTRTDDSGCYLATVEIYANDSAFEKHIAAGSAWSCFARAAKSEGWLVTDDSPFGFKVSGSEYALRNSLLRSVGSVQ
jgi:quinol monooxygenase YgiN